MSQGWSLIFWTRLTALAVITTAPLLHADDPAPSSDGYRTVQAPVGGGQSVTIRVKDQPDPYRNVSHPNNTGKYLPENIFSTTSSMANKKYSPPAVNDSNKSFFGESGFATKPYANAAGKEEPYDPRANTKTLVAPDNSDNRNASQYDKGFATAAANADMTKSSMLASANSSEQHHSATLESETIERPTSSLGKKTFEGPEADAVHHHLTKMDNGQMLVTDLPNRPLSIDEVRDLINHGFKPNTELPPVTPSKALNDPDYQPAPLRDMPAISAVSASAEPIPQAPIPAERAVLPMRAMPVGEDDSADAVPSPGSMAAPENSEPLPQP